MGQRVYDRERVHYEAKPFFAMVDSGQARYVEDQDLWVLKLDEGGQVIVRPHQVIDPDWGGMSLQDMADQQAAELYAENAWLRHAESAGWEAAEEDRYMEMQRGIY